MCNSSGVDGPTRKPLPAAFQVRQNEDGSWREAYISVFWLELLHPTAQSPEAQLAAFREYVISPPPFSMPKPAKTGAYAILPVGAIHAASEAVSTTSLQCRHEPVGEGDGHCGIHPNPAVVNWPPVADSPANLAVRQFLWQAMSYWEDTFLKPGAE
jgi:hypothetical protein